MKELLFILLYTQLQFTLGQDIDQPTHRQRPTTPEIISAHIPDDELHMEPDNSEITRCTNQVSNTFFNQGLRIAVASMKMRLPEGIPEYGIPPMEPLELEGMNMEISHHPVEMNISIFNLKVWDLTTFTKNNWFLDVNTRILDMSLVVPSFLVTGEFKLFPLGTMGNISIKFDGVTIKSKTKMKIIDTSRFPRATPIKADRAVSDMKFEKLRIKMSDLFPQKKGYEDINYAFRVFTERYSEMLYDEVKPFVQNGTEKIIVQITDAVLNSAVFHRRLPSNGILPGLNLSTLTNWYDRVRNALQVQLPSVVTRSHSYQSLISLLEAAFKSCRSYTDVTDSIAQPLINLLGLIAH
jgi:hypothetical protein